MIPSWLGVTGQPRTESCPLSTHRQSVSRSPDTRPRTRNVKTGGEWHQHKPSGAFFCLRCGFTDILPVPRRPLAKALHSGLRDSSCITFFSALFVLCFWLQNRKIWKIQEISQKKPHNHYSSIRNSPVAFCCIAFQCFFCAPEAVCRHLGIL